MLEKHFFIDTGNFRKTLNGVTTRKNLTMLKFLNLFLTYLLT